MNGVIQRKAIFDCFKGMRNLKLWYVSNYTDLIYKNDFDKRSLKGQHFA